MAKALSLFLLQCMSPQVADFVAKVGEGHLRRNNRIGTANFLNQHCVLALDLEGAQISSRRESPIHG
jgi:hypothetical protein